MVRQAEIKRVTNGRIYVTATFNNTLVSVTDEDGNLVCWGSSGRSGFKGSRKSTPFAATTAVEDTLKRAQALGLSQVKVFIKGPGPGRDSVLRVLKASRIRVIMIADITPIPHNGCRPKKRRRV